MAKGKGKKIRHGHSSNPQIGSGHRIEKRFKNENTQQASRIYPDLRSGPTVAPNYAFVPSHSIVPAIPPSVAYNPNSSRAVFHQEEMVSMDELSGYIFMCNGKTKADCYNYRVFGLPTARMDVLEKIKPQMKLFLFDFDLKLLHGIYIAASNGKLAIEPSAFGGRFSAQVRFEIFKNCLPLPESVFKDVIKDNYQGKNKFRQELSGKQVTNLISLFRPMPMPLQAQDETSGFQVPPALATRIQPMHLPPVGTQLPSELFYPAEAHQWDRPKNSALPPQDPYNRYVALPRDIKVFSTTNGPGHPYVTGSSKFSTALHGHASLLPSTRTAAYWAAVASEGLKQVSPRTYQVAPSGSTGLGLPVTSAGAAITPLPVPENLDAELLQQLGGTANDNHDNNPAVGSANPMVQEPALVLSQFQAPMHGTSGHLQPSSSSTGGYWTTVASKDPNLAYSAPYQWQWQPSTNTGVGAENVSAGSAPPYTAVQGSENPNLAYSAPYQWPWQPSTNTGVGAENVSAGSAPPYTAVQGSADEFVSHVGTSNEYYAHNVNLATTTGPVHAHDQVAYYSSAPSYWEVEPSWDPNQLYSGYYQVLPPGSSVIGGDPSQLSSGSYQEPPPVSSGLGGEHLAASSDAGAAATNDILGSERGASCGPKLLA